MTMSHLPRVRDLLSICRRLAAVLAIATLPAVALAAPSDLVVGPSSGTDAKFRFLYDPVASWPASVFWHYNPSGAPSHFSDASVVSSAMSLALSKWRAACNIDVAYGGTTGIAPESTVFDGENGAMPDEVNVLAWRPTPSGISGYTVGWPGPAVDGMPSIIDADVVIDPSKIPGVSQLERLLLHELGHVLGVNHSQFDSTLMSGPPYSSYNVLGDLTTDDVRACRCLYGPPPGVSAGLLCSMPPLIDFGAITAGASSQRSIQLANNGNASLTIAGVSTGAEYQATGCSPGTTLLPGVTCNMQVTFAPTFAGDHGSFVAIAVGEPEPYRIKLIGSASGGTASPFSANFSKVDFGTWPIGTPATTQRVTFKNISGAAVTVGSMLFEGAQPDEFIRSGQCKQGLTLAAGGTCTTDVGFTASAAGERTAQLVIAANDGRRSSLAVKGSGASTQGTPEPVTAQPVTVVEFYRSVSDHYFITIGTDEILALDTGLFQGWARTGLTFKAHAVSQSGYSPICRFYLPPPEDSHFYSASPQECATVQAQHPTFILESTAVMHLALPNPLSGVCPGSTIPIYRTWNRRPDTNHRYTTDIAVRDAMVALGHIAEGSGPNAVTFCAPQ